MIEEPREAELWLTNGIRVVCFACTAKSVRGFSIPAAVMDELAFYRIESGADADVEVQTSIRRGMAGFADTRLVKISTPYLKGGVLYDDFTRYYSKPDPDVLVWQASSLLMNPTLDGRRLARQQRLDSQRYAREFEAIFSDDIESYLPGAWIEGAIVEGRHELPRADGVVYHAAVDPSGGAADAFTLAIAHGEPGPRYVLDVLRSWKGTRADGVDLERVVGEAAEVLARYGLYRVIGDRYAGKWVEQAFRRVNVLYEFSEIDKSKAYLELEPALAQGRLELLDHPTLARELRQLEKRYKPGGKTPTIDHPKGAHDDHANAVALVIAKLTTSMHPAVAIPMPPTPEMARAAGVAPRNPVTAQAAEVGMATIFGRSNARDRQRFWR
jgi:hypothetical protein